MNNHAQVESVSHPSVSTDPNQQELYKKHFPNGGGYIFTFDIKRDAQKAKDLQIKSSIILLIGECCGC